MTPSVTVSPATRHLLLELSARTGRPVAEVLDEAVAEYHRRVGPPVAAVPGVDPADVRDAAAQADAGRLTSHDAVFAQLRRH